MTRPQQHARFSGAQDVALASVDRPLARADRFANQEGEA